MQSSQHLKGFFILLMATNLLPTYSGLVVGCCMGLSIVPLGRGLFQSAKQTVPNDPSPTALMTVKSLGPSRIKEAAVFGRAEDEAGTPREEAWAWLIGMDGPPPPGMLLVPFGYAFLFDGAVSLEV